MKLRRPPRLDWIAADPLTKVLRFVVQQLTWRGLTVKQIADYARAAALDERTKYARLVDWKKKPGRSFGERDL